MGKFAPSGPAAPSVVKVEQALNPAISNTVLGAAGTETGIAITSGSVRFMLRSRNKGTLQISFTSGQSGIVYFTVPKGNVYEELSLNSSSSITIYVQSSVAGDVIEVISWT